MAVIATVDLFAGAGGLSLGASAHKNVDVRCAIELDRDACATLAANSEHFSGEVYCSDIAALHGDQLREMAGVGLKESLVILGGPPCQPFSKAAYWTDSGEDARYRRARARGLVATKPEPTQQAKPDNRRDLVSHYLRLLQETSADGFLFENVPSLLHPRNREQFLTLHKAVEELGYKTDYFRVNAAEYGVAQRRERIFMLGTKRHKPLQPAKTHYLATDTPELFDGRIPAVTSGEAIQPASGDEFFEPEEIVSGRWADALRAVPPGWNYKALTAWAGHPEPLFEAETRFWNFLLKLDPDRPSWTIAATPGPWTGPFHWNDRRLRSQEMALLQGFPVTYQFSGSRRERIRQIGNAVPPPLATAMTKSLLSALDDEVPTIAA